MNEVFLIGKIVSNIKFDFMLNSKHKSISRFKIKTLDNQIIKIKAYDKKADFTYRVFNQDDIVFVYGRLKDDYIFLIDVLKFCF